MEIEDLRHLSLEECVNLLDSYKQTVTQSMQEKLTFLYRDLLHDKGAFILVGMGREYSGDSDGRIHPLAVARLKVVAYHILYNDNFHEVREEQQW